MATKQARSSWFLSHKDWKPTNSSEEIADGFCGPELLFFYKELFLVYLQYRNTLHSRVKKEREEMKGEQGESIQGISTILYKTNKIKKKDNKKQKKLEDTNMIKNWIPKPTKRPVLDRVSTAC